MKEKKELRTMFLNSFFSFILNSNQKIYENLNHITAIYDTLSFIERKYNEPITVQALEKISFYSYRNIQRIFKYACGVTIGGYQQRLKLENAYKLILYSKSSFSDIALEVGFETLASFSKAFKQYFGFSPKMARLNKPILFEANKITPIVSNQVLNYEIVYLPALKIYYQRAETHYLNDEIEWLWEQMIALDFPKNGVSYFGSIVDEALIADKIKCRYDACASVQPKTKNLPSKTIFGGKYVRCTHLGSYETIEETYKQIYAGWILTTQLEFSSAPIIEHYIKHASNTPQEKDFVTAILIPLKQ
jgi:AraC family transcriptional regulator